MKFLLINKKTRADLYHSNNSFGFHIADSKINLTLLYDIFLDPPILDDIGSVNIGYDALNVDIIFGMGPDKDDPKKLAVKISESSFHVDPESVKIELKNVNDFNKMVITIINAILPPLTNLLETAVSDYLQEGVDFVLGMIKYPVTINDMSFDFSFSQLPEITEGKFLSNTYDGKIFERGGEVPFENNAQLPKWIPSGKDLQLFISDYTLKAALVTVVELNMLHLSITQNDTKYMNTKYLVSFKELIEHFGK